MGWEVRIFGVFGIGRTVGLGVGRRGCRRMLRLLLGCVSWGWWFWLRLRDMVAHHLQESVERMMMMLMGWPLEGLDSLLQV